MKAQLPRRLPAASYPHTIMPMKTAAASVRHHPKAAAKASATGDFPTGFRTFGEWGPVYQPYKLAKPGFVKIRVIETGEELDYSIAHLLKDPEAT